MKDKVLITVIIFLFMFALPSSVQAKKPVITSEGTSITVALDKKTDSSAAKAGTTTEIINKKTETIKEKTKNIKQKAHKNIKNTAQKASEKVNSAAKTIQEEIEEAKKEMDEEAENQPDQYVQDLPDSMEKIKETAAGTVPPNGPIFNEDNMEVLGKTFWARKPIHPIGKYGYKGKLPNVKAEFEYKKPNDDYKCLIKSNPNAKEKDLVPAPRNDKAYVDIVVKKGSSSQYVNDVNDVIFILQKLINNMENDVNVQKFNAQVSNLLDNIFYIQDKYKNKPESNYISFYKMLELATVARNTAILRTEAQAYSKYLAYSGEGAVYKPERVQQQMDYFLQEINKTLAVLKAVN